MNVRKGFARLARVTALAYWSIALLTVGVTAFNALQDEGMGQHRFRVDFSATGGLLRACGARWEADGAPVPCDRTVEREGFTFTFPYDATDSEIRRAILFAVEEERTRRDQERNRLQRSFSERETGGLRNDAIARAREREQSAHDARADGERLFLPVDGGSNAFRSIAPWPGVPTLDRQRAAQVPYVHVWAEDGRAALDIARAFCSRPNVACGELRGDQVAVGAAQRLQYVFSQTWQPALAWLGVYLALWAVFRAIRYVALGFMDRSQSAPDSRA